MNYKLWNKLTSINGVEANKFLQRQPFNDYKGDIILIYGEDGKISQVECKEILANVYEIDVSLPLDEFMSQYILKISS